ncbi:hypothetical protein FNH22_09870 [Fulvivirga sp. M361]|uniref:DUF5946 family protein n=1 Tax=Fulvivirga sp. M361 TaxID=2594266 RepID=UPI00117B1B6A|nr:DUF5946 family protein [Fulvivirga sp. M361]TRX59458.1 hypothetical protein FNH22_09870 [Fulvivirga sp. M361]
MQNYIDLARKNGITLLDTGRCQFCGANTIKGVHECVEIFNLGFQSLDYSKAENHIYRFISVDAHTLQHPEIHGRWNNHFHLLRLHLIFRYHMAWNYELSPKLSDYLNAYKIDKQHEFLTPPAISKRGHITTTDVLSHSESASACKEMIKKWGQEVYQSWGNYHILVDEIAKGFMEKTKSIKKK